MGDGHGRFNKAVDEHLRRLKEYPIQGYELVRKFRWNVGSTVGKGSCGRADVPFSEDSPRFTVAFGLSALSNRGLDRNRTLELLLPNI